MAWYYTEPRPQRRPLDTPVVRGTTNGGTGGPPTGPAGGDLTGSYPNPTIAAGAVGDTEITSVSYAKVTGAPTIPTTLPPSGPAGGDLAGTYPNPDVKALAVGTPELADGAVTDAKVTSVAYGKVTGAPTSLPPSGTAGGDLSGSYPNPQIAPGAIVDADVSATAAIQYSKLTGTPTSLPPSGAASGDLTGTYPGPTIAAAKVTAPKLSPAPVAGDVGKMVTVATGPALAYTAVPTTLPPSGAASGDLTGSYPGPTIAAGAVTDAKIADVAATKLTGTIAQARLPTAPSGLLTANLNDAQVTNAKIADVAWGKVTGAPTSLPPSGTASGDLTGTYPGPTIAAGAVTTTKLGDAPTGVTTAKINDGAVTNVKIADVAWTKITGAPTAFPPSGAASGDLAGTYPGPTIGTGKVVTAALADAPNGVATAKINDGAVTNAKIADVAWAKVTGAPTALPPSGTAGGDLTGTYPNPTVAAGAVGNAEINDVAWGKVTGAPTSFPPSGAASGDLSGTYPGPTVAKVNGAALGTTTPLARGDLLVANATPALVRLPLGATQQVLQSNGTDVVWAAVPATGGPPTGAAGGDLAGTYPNPTIGAAKVTDTAMASGIDAAKITTGTLPVAQVPNLDAAKTTTGTFALARIPTLDVTKLPDAPAGITTTKINDAQVTDAKIAGMAYAKLTGAPTTLPPSGAAGGELAGTYPNPTVVRMAARLVRTGAQSMPSGTTTGITWTGTEGTPPAGMWNAGTPSRITAPVAGFYLCGAYGETTNNAAGIRVFNIHVSGTLKFGSVVQPGSAGIIVVTITTGLVLAAGDFVEFSIYQDSGVALEFNKTGANTQANFWLARAG